MENKTNAAKATQRYMETSALDIGTQIFALSRWQRTILRFLVELGEPAATARIRFKLVQGLYEEVFGKNGGIGTTKEMLEKIKKLREKGVKVPSYEGLETELKYIEQEGYIYKHSQPGKIAKHYWILNSKFVEHYLKRKQELAKEWAIACDKDSENAKKPSYSPNDPDAQKKAYLAAYPKQILQFYGASWTLN